MISDATKVSLIGLLLIPYSGGAVMAAAIYSDRASFESTLGLVVVDDYRESLYPQGDLVSLPGFNRYSDSAMSAVLGETTYQTTGHPDSSMVTTGYAAANGNFAYCAGCNGSFMLGFTSTSVGGSLGVFGVGFEMYYNYLSSGSDLSWPVPADTEGYHAFVTFGDNTTADYELPVAAPIDAFSSNAISHPSFWAITAPEGIKSIHIGAANGAVTQLSTFIMDNLTIGAPSEIPEPETYALVLAGLGLIGIFAKRRKSRMAHDVGATQIRRS